MRRVMRGRLAEKNMNGRRRKDEPFNPFAPNAGQKARDRKEKPPRNQRGQGRQLLKTHQ